MPHSTPIISTIVIGLVLAFAFGVVAHRLHLPPLIGYLLAGIAVGPFTPGFVADQSIANELAEIGVILLMFGVGLHFSLEDLLSVRGIAVSGAAAQAFLAVPLALALGWWQGWTPAAGVIFGIALSVASTVVVLRLLQERRLIETERGRITVGWLIVQDLAMVLVLVLLPPLAGALKGEAAAQSSVIQSLALTLAKIAGFVALMLIVGKRVIPALLHYVAHTGSRELFRLSVLSVALGVAYASTVLFGVSLALGAFFAGTVLSELRLSQQAATETLPFRDAFAVLFFVSVGMLFDPRIMLEAPGALLATVLIIVLGKSIAAYAIVRLFGHGHATALTISGSLAQIGEFSFILASLGTSLALWPAGGRDLILAGAIISILLNPLIFAALDRLLARRERARAEGVAAHVKEEIPTREPVRPTSLTGHVVLIGHGRVGSFISVVLERSVTPLFVIEDNDEVVKGVKVRGIEAVSGNAADPEVIRVANLSAARCLLVAIPDAFEGGQVVEQARAINPLLPIIARAHSQAEIEHLKRHGATIVVMGEHEIAKAMLEEIALPSMSTVAPEPQKGSESGSLASERRVTGRK